MQPFVNPNYFAYGNPYGNYYNNMLNQQRMQTLEQQYQTQPMVAQQATQIQTIGLNGKYVDSIENVKAADVMMDGSVMYFPNTDGKTIYTKQLQPDGTSRVITYSAMEQEEERKEEVALVQMAELLKEFKEEIFDGFDNVNDRLDKMEKQFRARGQKEAEKA